MRLERIYDCRVEFTVDINTRPTTHVLGGYYKSRRLVRVYSHDRKHGRRPLNELFDTFLHEVAHHLEYTEPQSFDSRGLPPRPRPDAQPALLADPRRAEVSLGRAPGAAPGRNQPMARRGRSLIRTIQETGTTNNTNSTMKSAIAIVGPPR